MIHAPWKSISRVIARCLPPLGSVLLFLSAATLLSSSPDNEAAPGSGISGSIRHIGDKNLQGTPIWISPGRSLSLFAGRIDGKHWICPRIKGGSRQPLCRRFNGEVVAVCSEGQDILIVLSDGDIHQVNYALVGADGRFVPAYHHPDTLELVDAWLPGSDCAVGRVLPEILAVNRDNTLLRFDRTTWRPLD